MALNSRQIKKLGTYRAVDAIDEVLDFLLRNLSFSRFSDCTELFPLRFRIKNESCYFTESSHGLKTSFSATYVFEHLVFLLITPKSSKKIQTLAQYSQILSDKATYRLQKLAVLVEAVRLAQTIYESAFNSH